MKTLRNLLFQIHLWTGLLAGVFFVLLGLSGSMLVYPELLGSNTPAVPAASPGKPLPLEQIIVAARAADPQSPGRAATIILPREAGAAIGIRFAAQRGGDGGAAGGQRGGRRGADGGQGVGGGQAAGGRDGANRPQAGRGPDGGVATYFIDPPTGQVLGASTPTGNGLTGVVHQMHEAMLLGGAGRTLVAWLGVGMLFLGLSGLYLWWPKKGQWKYAFGVRRNARGVRLYREIHGMFGIWFWLVFLFVSATSIPLGFPSVMAMISGSGPQTPPPGFGAPQRIDAAPGAAAMPLDDLLAGVAKATGQTPTGLTVPAAPDRAVTVALAEPQRNVAVNPYTGSVLTPPRAAGTLDRRAIELLHGGEGLGPLWKFLVFLTGFLPLIFVVTGLTMWLKKRKARIPMSQPIAP